jgi:hypothetical protein
MSVLIKLNPAVGGFAEDKNEAKEIRVSRLMPALDKGEAVILDFAGVEYATQSYVHALIGEALKKFGDVVLDRIEFRDCSPQLRSLVELVVDYSLSGFPEQQPV